MRGQRGRRGEPGLATCVTGNPPAKRKHGISRGRQLHDQGERAGHEPGVPLPQATRCGHRKVGNPVRLHAPLDGVEDFRGRLRASASPQLRASVVKIRDQLPDSRRIASNQGPQDSGCGSEQGDHNHVVGDAAGHVALRRTPGPAQRGDGKGEAESHQDAS